MRFPVAGLATGFKGSYGLAIRQRVVISTHRSDQMEFFKTKEKESVAEGRVLGRLLSREEISQVAGGEDKPKTDSWKDNGTCTHKSDKGDPGAPSIGD